MLWIIVKIKKDFAAKKYHSRYDTKVCSDENLDDYRNVKMC